MPMDKDGRPLWYLKMFGDAAIGEEDLAKMVEHRGKFWAALQVLLGEAAFFGVDGKSGRVEYSRPRRATCLPACLRHADAAGTT